MTLHKNPTFGDALHVESPAGTAAPKTLRLSRIRRGLRVKIQAHSNETRSSGPVDITGEDLYALREFLATVPEELFVKPAPRWTDGDIVVINFIGTPVNACLTHVDGGWAGVGNYGVARFNTEVVSGIIDGVYRGTGGTHSLATLVAVVKQASGRDL